MLRMFSTHGSEFVEIFGSPGSGSWIDLVAPSDSEINLVSSKLGVSEDLIRYPLDEEERSRIEVDDGQALIIINVPLIRRTNGSASYDTLPLGIIITESNIVTVCLESTELMQELQGGSYRNINTSKRTRFLLQLLFRTAAIYLKYLRQIDKKTNEIEKQLHRSMKNEELIKLLEMEKALVYFITSLKSNEAVMEKLLRVRLLNSAIQDQEGSFLLKLYPDDKELLEDVIIENKQAIEMAETYSNILSGMMDAFASVISNNVNIVMKFLTSVTIVMAIPTMVASFFGMNVAIPLAHNPLAFVYTVGFSVVLTITAGTILYKKRMF